MSDIGVHTARRPARRMRIAWLSLTLVCVSAPGLGGAPVGSLAPRGLRCEYATDPLGVDAAAPDLLWTVESRVAGDTQTAYQILVATSSDNLGRDLGDLWDSGIVQSNETVHIRYAGRRRAS